MPVDWWFLFEMKQLLSVKSITVAFDNVFSQHFWKNMKKSWICCMYETDNHDAKTDAYVWKYVELYITYKQRWE